MAYYNAFTLCLALTWMNAVTVVEGSDVRGTGSITSPGYPRPYKSVPEDVRRIEASDANQRLKLLVTELDLPEGDFLEVFDGEYCSEAGSTLIEKYHGKLTDPAPIFLSGHQACVNLLGINGGGNYRISYTEFPACAGTLRNQDGDIMSPGYPYENYPDSQNCRWTVEVGKGQRIRLTIQLMDIQKSEPCGVGGYDLLQINGIEGEDNEKPLCGKQDKPVSYTSESNSATVIFKSYDRYFWQPMKWRGFWIIYRVDGCMAPKSVTENSGNLRESAEHYRTGFTAHWECPTGQVYESGVKVRVSKCRHDNQWETWDDTCVDITCELPALPAHLTVTPYKKVYAVDDTVNFLCDVDWTLLGDDQLHCTGQGEWNANLPICKEPKVETCPMPPETPQGLVVTINVTIGAVVRYQCHEEYRLDGEPEITCLETGTWSGQAPNCTLITCEELSVSTGSHLTLDRSDNVFGSRVWYGCEEGYELIAGTLTTRQCTEDGTWDGQEPKCIKIRCRRPFSPPDGESEYQSLDVGSAVTYSCHPGYELAGSVGAVCREDGLWSSDLPMCIKVICPEPQNVTHALLKKLNNTLDQTVEIECEEGWYMDRQHNQSMQTLECLTSGNWSEEIRECVFEETIITSTSPTSIFSVSTRTTVTTPSTETGTNTPFTTTTDLSTTSTVAPHTATTVVPTTAVQSTTNISSATMPNPTTTAARTSSTRSIITSTSEEPSTNNARGRDDINIDARTQENQDDNGKTVGIAVGLILVVVVLVAIVFVVIKRRRARAPPQSDETPDQSEFDNPTYNVASQQLQIESRPNTLWNSNPAYKNHDDYA